MTRGGNRRPGIVVNPGMRSLLVVALLLAACGDLASPASGIRGTILAGPACPGPARVGSLCPDRPVAMTIEVVQGSSVVATFASGVDGRFSVALAPGSYTLRSKAGLPALRSATITVPPGAYDEVELHADTGMR
ncbi:MAG TPA: hypothetical protein VIN34_03360 [Candidatus Limnocylindria bacterium]